MNLVIKTSKGENAYLIRKLDPGYELMRWEGERISRSPKNRGDVIPAGWVKLNAGNGSYPSSLKHATMLIAEDRMMNDRGTYDVVDGLKVILDFVKELDIITEEISGNEQG